MNKLKLAVLFILIITAAYFGLSFAAEKMLISELDKLSEKTEFAGQLTYDSVSTNLLTAKFSANNVTFVSKTGEQEAHVETVSLNNVYSALISKDFASGLSFEKIKVVEKTQNKEVTADIITLNKFVEGSGKAPKEFSASIKGILLNREIVGPQFAQLSALGYESVKANVSLDYSIDEENKAIKVNNFNYGADDLFDFEIQLELEDIDLTNLNPIMLMFSYANIKLDSIMFSYTDASFFNKYIKFIADKSKQEPVDVIKNMEKEINAAIAQYRDPAVQDILLKLKDFLNNPQHISISAKPDTPITLGELQSVKDPAKGVKLLNAKASL